MRTLLQEIVDEVGGLTLYAASSLAGAVVRLEPHRVGLRRPVVVVPGFLGRGFNYARLQQSLIARGHPTFVADLGYNAGCIREKSEILEGYVMRHGLEDYFVVGHSMGGIISLGMSDEARQRVRHFVTVGTAYHGAVLSRLLPWFPAARQLNPGSDVIDGIVARARRQQNLTNIVGRWDEITASVEACRLGTEREIEGIGGHVRLIRHPEALEMIGRVLDEQEA